MVWRFLGIYMSFMLIRWFFMNFADFWTNFCSFLTFVLFYCLKWALKRPLLLEQFLVYKWQQFCGYEALFFFVEKYDLKWRQLELFFLIFCSFFVFFWSLDRFLSLLWLAYCFIWITYRLKRIFFEFMCFCNIKNFLTFSNFLSKLFVRANFFMIWRQVFLKFLISVFSRY